jgi:hypothetical protein
MKHLKFLVAAMLLVISVGASAATVSVLGGKSVSNSISDEKSNAWNIEQEVTFDKGRVWQFGYLNEGHKFSGDKRDGIYAMYKLPYYLTDRLVTSISAGPYFTATTVSTQTTSTQTVSNTGCDGPCSPAYTTTTTINNVGAYYDHYRLDLMASAAARYYVTPLTDVEVRWNHIMFTGSHKDTDVFLVGIGYDFK